MNQLRRLSRCWAWLPAFRAVAETEHLPRAGEQLAVSPPALSRTIKLLESDLGVSLFHRSGRSLALTEEGRRLLEPLRQAMRLVDEGIERLHDRLLSGTVPILASGVVTTAWLLPTIRRLRQDHPNFVPALSTAPTNVVQRLLRAELELSFQSDPIHHPQLTTEHLGTEQSGIYCGQDHPLAQATSVTVDALLEHAFVSPPPDAFGRVQDGWPEHLPRRFGLHVDQMRIGREACTTAGLLAVLPDAVGQASTSHAELVRLPIDDLLPPTEIYATYRQALPADSPTQIILEALRSGGSETAPPPSHPNDP